MKRNKKQLLVYLTLIIVSAVFIYLFFDNSQNTDYSQNTEYNQTLPPPNAEGIVSVVQSLSNQSDYSQNTDYNQNTDNNQTLPPPNAKAFVNVVQSLYDQSEMPSQDVFGVSMNLPPNTIILIVLAALAPIWMLSGYYFARKMELPGIYSDNRMSSKEFCFIATLCIVWGILLQLFTIHDSGSINLFNEFLFLIVAGCILVELFLRLFLVSFISWLLNVFFKAKLSRMTILLMSAAVSVVPVFLFTCIRHSISDFPLFDWILSVIIWNFLLNWIYISRGVLTTIVIRFCVFTLNYLVVLIIL